MHRHSLFFLMICFICCTICLGACDANKAEGNQDVLSALASPASYRELYQQLNGLQQTQENLMRVSFGTDTATAEESNASADTLKQESENNDYSQTNVQVEGIDEGDIVKTDGEYIYQLKNHQLIITQASGADTKEVSRTEIGYEEQPQDTVSKSKWPRELYVSDDKAAVISTINEWPIVNDTAENSAKTIDDCIYYGASYTSVDIYDISDPSQPKLIASLGQDGDYLSSRLDSGTIYLVSNHYIYDEINEDDPSTYVPSLYREGEKTRTDCDCIALMPEVNSTNYAVISAYSLEEEKITTNLSILGGGGVVYMNNDHIYLAQSIYESEESESRKDGIYTVVDHQDYTNTQITRIETVSGKLTATANNTVPGYLIDQFALDEYKDHMRLVATVDSWKYSTYTDEENDWINYKDEESLSSTALYILDNKLQTVGKIEDLAPDERVYSVRFDQDTGYFVTFRNVDPLFTADLSDPAAPKIVGELKIPGFSEYLHIYDEGLLFGLGMSADEETGATQGMKLSMFDITDPYKVTEKHTLNLEENWSTALYNHKAVLIDKEKNIIGFPGEESYLIYGYNKDNGFFLRAEIAMEEFSYDARGLYINDYAYIVDSSAIYVLDLQELDLIKKIGLPE